MFPNIPKLVIGYCEGFEGVKEMSDEEEIPKNGDPNYI